MPANPTPVEVVQPDGTRIKISLRGDEFYKWQEDENGYTILKDTSTDEWTYAEKDGAGSLRAGKHRVGAFDPIKLGIPKRLTDTGGISRAKAVRAQRAASFAFSVSGKRVSGAPTRTQILTGTMKNLVILAAFANRPQTFTQPQFDALFNQAEYNFDGAAGSVRDYYREVSYNTLTVQSTVYAWITLPENADFYGANTGTGGADANPRQMVKDAIDAVEDAGFDFSTVDGNGDGEVDGLDIIHSGRGEESSGNPDDIWAHQWYLAAPYSKDGVSMQVYHTEAELRNAAPNITHIGVICHEIGHVLGLPDLYDTTDASAGIGAFCLMGSGSWNGTVTDGRSPAHLSAWCKKTLGWASATQLSASGAYSLPRIEDHSSALIKFPVFPSTQEYFLLENRQPYSFDSALPGPNMGLLIWHIDEGMLNNDDKTHYLVDLEEADGVQDLEASPAARGTDADYFRSNTKTTFEDYTVPGSRSYSGTPLGILLSGVSASADPMTFNLEGVEALFPTLKGMDKLKAYPNPFYPSGTALTIAGLPPDPDPKIYIYNTAGELVRTLKRGDGIDSGNTAMWNGRDKAGAKVASGLYIYLARTANSGTATGKFYIFW